MGISLLKKGTGLFFTLVRSPVPFFNRLGELKHA
jgi:hypothetical protein